nr:myc-associated zinc finger protein-like [Drosophila suzukii]
MIVDDFKILYNTHSCPSSPEWMHPIPSPTWAPGRPSSAAVAPAAAAADVAVAADAAVAVAAAAAAVAGVAVVAAAARRSGPREWAGWGRHPARPSNRRPIPGCGASCSAAGPPSGVADPRLISMDSGWNSGNSGCSAEWYAAWSAFCAAAASPNSPNAFAPRR